MATVSEMLTELSDHGFADTSQVRKLALINDTVWDICSREPWPFLEDTRTLTFSGSSTTSATDLSDLRAVLSLVRSDGTPLQPRRLDEMEKSYGTDLTTATGTVTDYYFVGDELHFYPIPGAAETVRARILKHHPELTDASVEADILIPLRHHRLIVLGTLFKLYDLEDDFDLSARFQGEFENRLLTMRGEVWSKQYDRPDRLYDIDTEFLEFLN